MIVDLVALNLVVVLVFVIVMVVSRIYSNRNCNVEEEFAYLNSLCNSINEMIIVQTKCIQIENPNYILQRPLERIIDKKK